MLSRARRVLSVSVVGPSLALALASASAVRLHASACLVLLCLCLQGMGLGLGVGVGVGVSAHGCVVVSTCAARRERAGEGDEMEKKLNYLFFCCALH